MAGLSVYGRAGLGLGLVTTHSPADQPFLVPIPRVGSQCALQGEVVAGEVLTPQWFFQRLVWNSSPRSEASDIEGPFWLRELETQLNSLPSVKK